ncbi:MAG: hypothetical protein COT34_01730 [Candidatus Nealsonbacteria bacterium CG08_land_8_20_14_0_20_43_11]|uniref:4-vinyl reductase 4VR domain-containing protein n=1 Tax=Candidatus Nealsonbacteria bacterium CG08_land_8_20_14_0_20_43_11 TaxID=1974706 RepID=A0A2M6T0F2_9BACT|nr:MAG: hypothetical protein COT34_01730 [Candidatus Nealsonbacteria bacterium CG08_land_8_20_14_0_20_43_11]
MGAKVYIKYFLSLQKTFNAVPQYWKKFETCGELELYKLNEKEKYLVMRLKNYDIHPIMCPYLGGYFLGLAQNIIRSDKITIEETACIYKGGAYHEYTIRWQ